MRGCLVTKRNKRRQDGERGDGKCGNEVTWNLAERGDSPMRNVLRLETKGCPKEKEEERWGASVGEGDCAYVICRIWGGEEKRLWGIPWEIPNE